MGCILTSRLGLDGLLVPENSDRKSNILTVSGQAYLYAPVTREELLKFFALFLETQCANI